MSSASLRALKWGDVAPRPENVTETPQLSTNASVVLPRNPNRVGVYVTNPSAIAVNLRWGENPTTTVGYPLEANGGQKSFTYEEDGERIFQELRAIAASGTPSIFVTSDVMPAVLPRKVA